MKIICGFSYRGLSSKMKCTPGVKRQARVLERTDL